MESMDFHGLFYVALLAAFSRLLCLTKQGTRAVGGNVYVCILKNGSEVRYNEYIRWKYSVGIKETSMSFYTYAFIENQAHINNMVQYALSFLILMGLFFAGIKYLENRLMTKYRDLCIILLLLVIFFFGVRWDDYVRDQDTLEANSRMAVFMQAVSETLRVPKEAVAVNSRQLKQGMIVKYRDSLYKVDFASDFAAYRLERIYLIHQDIQIIDKEERR